MQFLQNYLEALQNISTQDKEHTYRTPLENLLNAFKGESKSIHIKHEPNNDKEGRGAPDFLITKDSLTLGYIENKRVNAPLDEIAQSEQIKKYFRLSSNIILTDYLRFCLLHQDEKGKITTKQECRICELSQLQAFAKNPKLYNVDSKTKELEQLFTLFFSQSPSPINTAKEFANALAQRTRILKDEMIEKQSNAHIQGLFNAFKESLYKELDFITFADSFAQTLTYSLFLARLNSQNEVINLDNAYNFIPKSFSLIQAMSKFLRELKELDSIKWLLEEIIAIINHIDISEIIKDLNKLSQKDLLEEYIYKDPYLHLYEDFLKEYDESLREVRGVYYTPAPVVKFIIDSIDLTLQKDFNKQGLQSALNDSDITLLDFATGTGTFLLEAFRKALESSNKNSPKYNPKALIQRFYGFEFLIAPYTITHLKISQAFKEEFEAQLNENESLNITLTNTLYVSSKADKINKQSNLFVGMAELTKEFEKAQEIKGKDILIITGNPPYSGASANKGLYEDEVRITYGLEPKLAELTKAEIESLLRYFSNKSKDNAKTFKSILDRHKLQNEKNPKWLLDDYVKFIRFAESKIEKQEGGIFAFISNNAFLDNTTFRGMRYHLLKTFDKIYILDLHGNTRKKETTPSGDKDDNVFDIMQGVSINIFVKLPCESKSTHHAESLSPCNTESLSACHTESTPTCHTERSEVSKNTKNKDISHSLNMTNNLATIYHYDLYGKRKDKYNFLAKNTLDSIPWQILNPQNPFYLFIPQNESLRVEYDKGWSVKDIFKVSGVGICSKRDKIVFHNSKESLKSMLHDFITKPKDELYKIYDIGEDSRDWKLESAIEAIRENKDNLDEFIKLCHYRPFDMRWTYYINKSRAFMAYPVYDVFQHFLQDSNDMWVENFTQEFRAFIDSKYNEHFSPEQILGYIYAVLFHKDYREKYLDFLKIDFPKIPFAESKEKFLALSDLGLELLDTHLMRERERERERAENDENDLQYRASNLQTDKRFTKLSSLICGTYNNGNVLHFKQGDRGQLSIPTLSSQGIFMKNIGLVCDRGSKLSQIDNIFITDSIIDLHLVGSGSYVFPLYLTQRI
ncbi:DNA methyltransferase [Helicobacter cinaedi]|uniref:type ISP restriction/modification enzyme n=1 Tax=Helicobacter cinaedi TaxID=213 RepID=UPI001EEEDE17|nr:type ISP restriction/modification enzyme [Helicobacter cinaedi]BDB64564.1 DNA methyltransferase [Helicobacter cinaedi]